MAAPANGSRNPAERRGTLRTGKMGGELRIASGILGVRDPSFVFLSSPPIYGGFVYLSFPHWVLGNGRPAERPPEPTERQGKLRNGKISELRIDPGIYGFGVWPFDYLPSPSRLRRLRVFTAAELGCGRLNNQSSTPIGD